MLFFFYVITNGVAITQQFSLFRIRLWNSLFFWVQIFQIISAKIFLSSSNFPLHTVFLAKYEFSWRQQGIFIIDWVFHKKPSKIFRIRKKPSEVLNFGLVQNFPTTLLSESTPIRLDAEAPRYFYSPGYEMSLYQYQICIPCIMVYCTRVSNLTART